MEPRVSVIMPMGRPVADAHRAIDAVLDQRTIVPFELILIVPKAVELFDPRVRQLRMEKLNPAARRNLAVREARGEILAFVDDDAFPEPEWIDRAVRFLDSRHEVLAVGGPDPAPLDSTIGERISDTLLAAPVVGSGIAAHRNRQGTFILRAPHDVALVNLFVRKEALLEAGGFDESIGYAGEDTALVELMMQRGRVAYSSEVVVRHRRRSFPREYLRQRWQYRVKTGRLLATGKKRWSANFRIASFLAVGIALLAIAAIAPPAAAGLLLLYIALVTVLGARVTRLPPAWWWVIPFAFAAHHATYFAGLVTGLVLGGGTPRPAS